MADVKLAEIRKSFGKVEALKGLDLEIRDKEFFVLLGPTGAGKTTTLKIVAGLEQPDRGEVSLDGVNVDRLIPAMRDVAFVFQYYTLYPHYTVRQNLEFPLKSRLRRVPQPEIDRRVAEVARVLRIEHLLERGTTKLSGGEMQRVGIGRAIVRAPKVFLMDEPLSNLDAKLRETMRAELARLHNDLGATFLYVTHDQVEAMTMGDRIGVLEKGKLLQVGTPEEIYHSPNCLFVAKFVGSPIMNIFSAQFRDGRLEVEKGAILCGAGATARAARSLPPDGRILVGTRPESVQVSRERGGAESFAAGVYFVQSLGEEDILNLRSGEVLFQAVAKPNMEFKVGEQVCVTMDADRVHLFDAATERRL
jgi:multiple sugar transport system ATP-binding protein